MDNQAEPECLIVNIIDTAITAGAASTVVSGQVVSDTAAKLLTVAGPLWLAFVAWTSYRLARRTS